MISGCLKRVTNAVSENPGEELIRFNCLLKGLVHGDQFSDALHLFKRARSSHDPKPDNYTLSIALTACANLHDVTVGGQLHAYSIQSGLESFLGVANALLSLYAKSRDLASVKRLFGEIKEPDVYSYTTLLSASAKLGEIDYACRVFGEMPQCSVPVWNAVITGCGGTRYYYIAFDFFLEMHAKGVRPDHFTLASILSYCSSEQFDFGRQVHCLVIKTGFICSVSVVNSLVTMYFDCKREAEAYGVFEDVGFEVGDQTTFNAIIAGLVSMERYDEALMRFKDMQSVGANPSELTFVSVMSACLFPQIAQQVHGLAIKRDLADCNAVSNAAISMYSKTGDLAAACLVFSRLKEKDIVSWNAIMASYAKENQGEDALLAYLEMQRNGIPPDEYSIGSLLASSESQEER